MITKSEVMELLIKSCPSYSNRWEAYLQSNYRNGDEYVKEAVSIGLLEDIQNVALGLKINLEVFVPYLRPISLKWWGKLIDYWSGKLKKL